MILRRALESVKDALSDTPVVLIHGPRQSGKSTLAVAASEFTKRKIVTLDDPEPFALAKTRPAEFIQTFLPPVMIDEVQRAPEVFLPIKAWVDRNRIPGSFLLTGSANALMLPRMADSLAGRMEVIDLLPLSQIEIDGSGTNPVDRIFDDAFDISEISGSGEDAIDRMVVGGYPEPVLRSARRRDAWFDSYIRTILERDVRDLANIDGLTQLPRLLSFISNRVGTTLNLASLSRDVGIPHTTLTRYVDLMQALFLLQMVPAWSNEGARFAKTAKCYLVDSGLLCHLRRLDSKVLRGDRDLLQPILENFVANELARSISTSKTRPMLMHLRTVRQKEVDFVLERSDGRIVGIDLCPNRTLKLDDADGIRWLAEIVGDRFERGVVLYFGQEVRPLAPNIWGVPIDFLWAR